MGENSLNSLKYSLRESVSKAEQVIDKSGADTRASLHKMQVEWELMRVEGERMRAEISKLNRDLETARRRASRGAAFPGWWGCCACAGSDRAVNVDEGDEVCVPLEQPASKEKVEIPTPNGRVAGKGNLTEAMAA